MIESDANWEGKKKILIILAHPDDPEFFLGGTIARWIEAGHVIEYCLLTKGERGSSNLSQTIDQIAEIRIQEQINAAKVLGVQKVQFLDFQDGYLIPDLTVRFEIVKEIRQVKPDILVTCDPLNYFANRRYINHPDHRSAGQAVIDAVFPAAGNPFFSPDLLESGYAPHTVEEVWMSLTGEPNIILNVTDYWQARLNALLQHRSQIGDSDDFVTRMKSWLEKDENEQIVYFEKFRRICFRR